MTRIKRGLKVVTWIGDEMIIRQRIKLLDDEGNLVRAPMIGVREKKRYDKEPLDDVRKRAEENLEREVEKFKNELRKRGYEVVE